MRDHRGIALIIVLWIAVLLSSITITGAYLVRLEQRQAYYSAREVQLISAAMAGMEKVKAELIKDDNVYDSLKEGWKSSFKDDFSIGEVTVSLSVEDEESKLNLNTASRERLAKLAPLERAINSNELVDSLIDWTDKNTDALPGGAEEGYYKLLMPPVQCKNGPLDSIEELVFVKGFQDTKVIDSLRKVATIYSDGKVNINTASLETLMTLPKVNYLLAQGIIAHRNGKDLEQGTEDDLPYDTIQRVEEVVGKDVYKEIQSLLTVKSSYFKVTIRTSFGKYSKMVEAMLYRQGRIVQV